MSPWSMVPIQRPPSRSRSSLFALNGFRRLEPGTPRICRSNEPLNSAAHSDQQFSLSSPYSDPWSCAVGIAYCVWRTGLPSPKPGLRTGPEIACAVLIQRHNHSAQTRRPALTLRTAASLSRRAGHWDSPACRPTPFPYGPQAAMARIVYQALGIRSACRHSN